jgi:hypothetical protein
MLLDLELQFPQFLRLQLLLEKILLLKIILFHLEKMFCNLQLHHLLPNLYLLQLHPLLLNNLNCNQTLATFRFSRH